MMCCFQQKRMILCWAFCRRFLATVRDSLSSIPSFLTCMSCRRVSCCCTFIKLISSFCWYPLKKSMAWNRKSRKCSHIFIFMVHVIDIIELKKGLAAYRSFLSDLIDTNPLYALLFLSYFLILVTSVALVIQWISSILYHRKALFFVWYRSLK